MARRWPETHDGARLLVWDVPRSEPRLQVELPGDGVHLAYTPDGTVLAVSTASDVHLLDAATGELRTTLTRPPAAPIGRRHGAVAPIKRFTIAPDGTWLAVAYGGASAPTEIWNLATGNVRALPSW